MLVEQIAAQQRKIALQFLSMRQTLLERIEGVAAGELVLFFVTKMVIGCHHDSKGALVHFQRIYRKFISLT